VDNVITINNYGRLGNAMFRNCAASILSKKFDIKVERYLELEKLQILHPRFYEQGTKIYEHQVEVRYRNFLQILQQNDINYGLNLICPCQSKEFVLTYKEEILNQFDLQRNQQHKNDLFVHVRLGDCIEKNRVPSLEYYIQAIEQANFEKGYISSDTPSHEIVTYLMSKFNLALYENKPAETLNFAKDFGSLVLSNGTFSWWMAFLSKAESIFYPYGGPKWNGDIFVFSEWTPIKF
jgi:hypothetical protein